MRKAICCLTGGWLFVYFAIVAALDLAMMLIVLAGVFIAFGTP